MSASALFRSMCYCSIGLLFCGFTVINDFEHEVAYRVSDNMQFHREKKFAAGGKYSLRLTAPAWETHLQEWPALHIDHFSPDNWLEFDVLALDAINAGAMTRKILVKLSCGNLNYTKAFDLPPFSYRLLELQFSELPSGFDLKNMQSITLFTECPADQYELYVDRLLLRKTNESVTISAGFEREVCHMITHYVSICQNQIAKVKKYPRQFSKVKQLVAYHEKEIASLTECIQKMHGMLNDKTLSLSERSCATITLPLIFSRLARLEQVLSDQSYLFGDVMVKIVSAMDRVYPHDNPVPATIAGSLHLAKNDKGGMQIVVMPLNENIAKVSVSVSDLISTPQHRLDRNCFTISPLGFINVKEYSKRRYGYLGWTPDPLLHYLEYVDINASTAQSFYIDCQIPLQQPAGLYRGIITIQTSAQTIVKLPISVQIYDVEMPDRALLPMAIATTYPRSPHIEKISTPQDILTAKRSLAEFLSKYYLSLDHLYKNEPNELELLKELQSRNILGGICIRYIQASADEVTPKTQYLINSIRPYYEALKRNNLLGNAYLYGFDELDHEHFSALETVAAALHREFPELKIMTTAYDNTLGTKSILKSVDWWCPLLSKYLCQPVDSARAAGDQVWWYISCDPAAPFPNMQLEDPPLESRILGAMAAKYRPDGFLFYETAYWKDNREIAGGPYLEWQPHSHQKYNGDGVWFYPGKNGTFLPSLRLENFRAGLSDFTLFTLLRRMAERFDQYPTKQEKYLQWRQDVKKVQNQLDRLVVSPYKFSRTPLEIESWRHSMLALIEQSPVKVSDLELRMLKVWGQSVYRNYDKR